MKGMTLTFRNRPNSDGTITGAITIADCLVAPSGSPSASRPHIIVHLPKTSNETVDGAWLDYAGRSYHVIGHTAPTMAENTPTRWNRYIVAEAVY